MLAKPLETVFVGGGRRRSGAGGVRAPAVRAAGAAELTVEANRRRSRRSLRACSLDTASTVCLSARRASSRACSRCWSAAPHQTTSGARCILSVMPSDNISFDFIYGIPGQSTADLEADIEQALLLRPSTCPVRARGQAGHAVHPPLRRRAGEAGRGHGGTELVVTRLTEAGYRWYRRRRAALSELDGGRDLHRGTTSRTGSDATTSV